MQLLNLDFTKFKVYEILNLCNIQANIHLDFKMNVPIYLAFQNEYLLYYYKMPCLISFENIIL